MIAYSKSTEVIKLGTYCSACHLMMLNPYSHDLRLRVTKVVERGKTTREVGEQFQVSSSFVSKMHRIWKTSGCVRKRCRFRRSTNVFAINWAISEQLREDIVKTCDHWKA
jgi:transposase